MYQDQPDLDHEQDALDTPLDARNYITPAGFARMQEEVNTLLHVERPNIAQIVCAASDDVAFGDVASQNEDSRGSGDFLYANKRLQEIDARVRFLTTRLRVIEIVDPSHQRNRGQVFFGATVTYVNARGEEQTIRILGVDEVDFRQGEVSLQSSIARALLRSRVGDTVSITIPAGREAVDVLAIRYPPGCGGR